jgi:hypothetical protein
VLAVARAERRSGLPVIKQNTVAVSSMPRIGVAAIITPNSITDTNARTIPMVPSFAPDCFAWAATPSPMANSAPSGNDHALVTRHQRGMFTSGVETTQMAVTPAQARTPMAIESAPHFFSP